VVFVNGEKQIPGKLRKQPYNYEIGGKVLDFNSSEKRDYVLMDPTNAYPKNELKGWRRHIILEKPEITVVLDEINANPGSKIEVRFHPGVDFEVKDNFVLLESDKGKMALIPVTMQDFSLVQGKHAMQYINATKDFYWIPYFDAELKSKEVNTTVATLILPVANADEARTIVSSKQLKKDNSGNLSLSFKKKGISYAFQFSSTGEGLQLKNNK
jgi:hypothetical protein